MARFTQTDIERYAQSVMEVVNLMVYLASPCIVEAKGVAPGREYVIAQIDEYIGRLESFGSGKNENGWDILSTIPFARKVREACEAWQSTSGITDSVRNAARAFLKSFGVDEPEEGWDRFTGFPEN
jgi:hypothetical protein